MFNIILVYCSAQKHISFELSWNIGIKTFHIVNSILNRLTSSLLTAKLNVRLKCYLHEICSSWSLLILGVCVFGSYRTFWFPLVHLTIWPSIDKFSWISFHTFFFQSVGRRLAIFFWTFSCQVAIYIHFSLKLVV